MIVVLTFAPCPFLCGLLPPQRCPGRMSAPHLTFLHKIPWHFIQAQRLKVTLRIIFVVILTIMRYRSFVACPVFSVPASPCCLACMNDPCTPLSISNLTLTLTPSPVFPPLCYRGYRLPRGWSLSLSLSISLSFWPCYCCCPDRILHTRGESPLFLYPRSRMPPDSSAVILLTLRLLFSWLFGCYSPDSSAVHVALACLLLPDCGYKLWGKAFRVWPRRFVCERGLEMSLCMPQNPWFCLALPCRWATALSSCTMIGCWWDTLTPTLTFN